MEIRVLRYFVEIARCGSMSKAAESLHVSQSALSKQMSELEAELGKKLFKRVSRGLLLTDEGMLLRKRAEDILEMVEKTEDEFKELGELKGGDVRIACAESHLISHLAKAVASFKEDYPLFRYHLYSGDSEIVLDKLDRGAVDFAIIVEQPDFSKYNYLEIPGEDVWGLLVKSDSDLAKKEKITAQDLVGLELICSRQSIANDIARWCPETVDSLNFSGTMNLNYNASIFVDEGLGCLLTLDKLSDTSEESGLSFIPLYPKLTSKLFLVWRKYQMFTPIAERFLERLEQYLA